MGSLPCVDFRGHYYLKPLFWADFVLNQVFDVNIVLNQSFELILCLNRFWGSTLSRTILLSLYCVESDFGCENYLEPLSWVDIVLNQILGVNTDLNHFFELRICVESDCGGQYCLERFFWDYMHGIRFSGSIMPWTTFLSRIFIKSN